jgi:hypothetical protein
MASGDPYIDDSRSVQRLEGVVGESSPVEEFGGGVLPGTGCREEVVSCLGGVAVDSRSGRVFVVAGGSSEVQEYVLEPPNVPELRDASVSGVTAGTAVLSGEVNPRSEPGEEAASWWFEYVSEEQFAREGYAGAVRVPAGAGGQLVASYEWSPVSVAVSGLRAGAGYRYRLVGENAISRAGGAPVIGEERVFTTQPAGVFGLLDGRGWELVSPADKQGALIEPLARFREFAVQAAAGGGAVTYVASDPTEAGPASNPGYTQVLSGRGVGGWWSRDVLVGHERATAVTEHPEVPLFSEDLSLAVVQPLGAFDAGLSPLASEQTAYLHHSFTDATPGEPCVSGCFTPLVTAANTPEGTEFGVREEGPANLNDQCPPDPFCGPQFEAASPDLEHVVVHSQAALTGGEGGLFEWSGGVLTFVGEGEVGTGREEVTNFIVAGSRAVSVDGSRVVFKGRADGKDGLLLRDTVTGETVQLGGSEAVFVGASSDDSRVYFTSEEGGPLEECEILEEPGGALECRSSDLTGTASVLAPLLGVSEDGSSVYFVSRGALTGAELDASGEAAVNGQPNLYASRGGVVKLVAVLAEADASDWGNEEFLTAKAKVKVPEAALAGLTARVSPDGEWVAFLSRRSLTGYDNRDAVSGRPDPEVFLYDAVTGVLVCASCDATGARPRGGASVPGWTMPLYQSRYLSDGGRLFFDSPDSLVPQDTNNTEDVYEYEPPAGEGAPSADSCTRMSVTFVVSAGGCVDLISSGSSPEPSSFLDASENGDDVFFVTAARLSPSDLDSAFDVYDARVGGGEPAPAKPVECQGDACQAPVSPPETFTPGSLTFYGPGNATPLITPIVPPKPKAKPPTRAQLLAKALKTCHKKRPHTSRTRCERTAHKHYAPTKKHK